jgi:PiT family inorganic phosphate transporter
VIFVGIILIGLLLAYSNGANDNFKGVATLLGGRTTSYRRALVWATTTTALGSVAALVFAQQLLVVFSGKGLVPSAVVTDPVYPAAVALAAALTVLAATRLGFPISTTHALIGGMVGAGLVLAPGGLNAATLSSGFVLPLLVSPLIAIGLTAVLYPPLRLARRRLGVTKETCVCIGAEVLGALPGAVSAGQAVNVLQLQSLNVGGKAECKVHYRGGFMGISAGPVLDVAHYLTAGAVSFARGLNDTPKIAALLVVGQVVAPVAAIAGVTVFIAAGGVISARRVAQTMSHRVTDMNAGQGFTANLVTAFLVIVASRFGLPVSTTHVSCGSLFGIGAVTQRAHWGTIGRIALAWLITLPVAIALGAACAALLAAV